MRTCKVCVSVSVKVTVSEWAGIRGEREQVRKREGLRESEGEEKGLCVCVCEREWEGVRENECERER